MLENDNFCYHSHYTGLQKSKYLVSSEEQICEFRKHNTSKSIYCIKSKHMGKDGW